MDLPALLGNHAQPSNGHEGSWGSYASKSVRKALVKLTVIKDGQKNGLMDGTKLSVEVAALLKILLLTYLIVLSTQTLDKA